jgi:6-phosphogluconolactonase (cycloisomerase 2 family)
MKNLARLATLSGALVIGAALAAAPASASTSASPQTPSTAVFVQTDNVDGNSIVAYDRAPDGTLAQAGVYATGGLGGVLTGSVVDHLASQGSLTYDRVSHTLYAVNAGSNTLTVFAVKGDQLSRTQVISSGGAFPLSVTTHDHSVFVLNGLEGGSIQGYYRIAHHLRLIPRWHRELNLPIAEPQFTHVPGQIAFTPNGSKLVVTTKAASNSIEVFKLGVLGKPSAEPVVNFEGSAVPFGVTFDPSGRLVVAEAGTNSVATFTILPSGILNPVEQLATGQAATCWIVRNGDYVYASNAGSANLSDVYDDGHSALGLLGTTTTDAGTVDAAASHDGQFVYAQAGSAGIVDEYQANADGSLTAVGSVTVPGAVGGEGIVAL